MKYRSKDGDILDAVCFDYYGHEQAVEQVLEANPNLAAFGTRLTPGTIIELPNLPEPEKTTISLWD